MISLHPMVQAGVGLVLFYIGLKWFSGGFKAMGDVAWLQYFTSNIAYMFIGGIVLTLAWQSSSLSTAAIVGLMGTGLVPLPAGIAFVLGANIGTTGTIWLAAALGSNGFPVGDLRHIAVSHTLLNVAMATAALPFVRPLAALIQRIF